MTGFLQIRKLTEHAISSKVRTICAFFIKGVVFREATGVLLLLLFFNLKMGMKEVPHSLTLKKNDLLLLWLLKFRE